MDETKLIAFYLPQYHEIPENDKWWGKGFTEWTNTRKTKPLFKGHYQPKQPYNSNYYNLLDNDVKFNQVELAKEYGIYGFCYYHYWFKGKKLLEKPLEQVLNLKELNFPFCLSWANEPWTRSWDGKKSEILMPQDYGNKEDWEEHFSYLIRIFKDDRYILIDNKPLFLIYRTENIENCDLMLELWNELCIKNGFNGIYAVETMNSFQNRPFCNYSSAVVEFEPMYTLKYNMPLYFNTLRAIKKILNKLNLGNVLDLIDYDFVWQQIIKREVTTSNKKIFLGAFVDWDNTARKGKKSMIMSGGSPDKFEKYLSKQIVKSKQYLKSEFIFLNAWNEWAEGTYLEPDEKYKFKYLEAVKKALRES